ncbi:MAG: transporter [Paracoccaceae bacterium]
MITNLRKYIPLASLAAALALGLFAAPAYAQDNQDVALQLENPLSDLARLSFQYDYDSGFRGNGGMNSLSMEVILPFSIGENWKVVSHTVLPALAFDSNWPGDAADDKGTGDMTQSFYFSPKSVAANGLIWGVGPVFKFPTANEDSLGWGQYAMGPAAIVLKQDGRFTYGGMINHLSTYAGDRSRRPINVTSVHPFASYVTPQATTLKLSSEAFYDWEEKGWAVPIIFEVKQTIKLGKRPVQIGAGVRYWATAPERYADGWGWRVGITFPLQ